MYWAKGAALAVGHMQKSSFNHRDKDENRIQEYTAIQTYQLLMED